MRLSCQPCSLRSPSWGSEPLRLASVTATVQRLGAMQLHGTLSTGGINATWHGQLKPNGLLLNMDLPPTPVRDGYALLASAIPELAVAQIDGTFALHASLSLPDKTLTLEPQLQGMSVQGLGTAQWANARSPCGKGLPPTSLSAQSLLARAVIAAEDQRFFEHPGYDLVEMGQALRSNQRTALTPIDSSGIPLRGASTLSQQVAKLLVTGGERSPCASCANCSTPWKWNKPWARRASCACTWTTRPGAATCAVRRRQHFTTLANTPTTSVRQRPSGWLPCCTTRHWRPSAGPAVGISMWLGRSGWRGICGGGAEAGGAVAEDFGAWGRCLCTWWYRRHQRTLPIPQWLGFLETSVHYQINSDYD